MERLQSQIILEVLGKPKEHVDAVMQELLKQIRSEEHVKVIKETLGEVKEIEKSNGFYTGFLDVEIDAENILYFMMICFKYMPSHVEITTPEKLTLRNNELNEFFNELVRTLHAYDEVARVVQIQKQQLENELRALKERKEQSKSDS